MKVSTRGEYGVRAMVALAHYHGNKPVALTTIAKDSHVPAPYLEQLIAPLRRAGLVESRRGAQGGYQLARPPAEIRVGEIYRIMEGPVAPMDCVSEDETDQTCPLIPNCETRPVWVAVRDSIVGAIDSITLADLVRDSAVTAEPEPQIVA
jgi:Rrf2 family cysteine metabolism transcriptional repressor